MQIRGERGSIRGKREHGENVDANKVREGKSWRPERAWRIHIDANKGREGNGWRPERAWSKC